MSKDESASYGYIRDVFLPKTNEMSLRDYFAAKAMSTLLQTINGVSGCNRYEYRIAEDAYIFADAMLKAREA